MQISTTGEVIIPEMVTRKMNIPLIYICTKIFVTASKLLYMNNKSKTLSRLFYTKCDHHFSEFKKPTPPFVFPYTRMYAIYLTLRSTHFWGFGHFRCWSLYKLCLMIDFHPQAAKFDTANRCQSQGIAGHAPLFSYCIHKMFTCVL